jgi:hypothetical protein
MKIITTGRDDYDRYFSLSGIRENRRLNHYPFIVFNVNQSKNELKVEIVHSIKELLEQYTDEVQVMAQWAGQWRSDFMQFNVGDLRQYIKENPKKDYQII